MLLLVTGVITCAVGVVIGLPALRLSGLYLALITLMAAGAVNVVLTTINFPNGGGGFTGRTSTPDLSGLEPVGRPGIAEGDTAYYRYTIVVCALMFLLIALHFAVEARARLGGDPRERAGGARGGRQHRPLQALGVRARVVHDGRRAADCSPPSSATRPRSDSRRRTR